MNTLILNLHILGAGFLLAILIYAIILLFKKPFSNERINNIRMVINAGAFTIIWMIISGAFLFSDRPQTFLTSILFWIKIGLFILDLIVGLVLVNRRLKSVEKEVISRAVSPSSLIIWVILNLAITLIIIASSIMVAK